ncbi:MAG TPA: hypothetical protein VGK27_09470 [Candidatus Deferrimicrobiaceae bacterium]|jgi:predicted CXXCH cytochrome family protein
MRKSKVLLLVPLMLLFCVGMAQAAFDNSHHDMRTYNAQKEGCFQCHGRSSTFVFSGATDNQFGNVGGLCLARCHAGVSGQTILGPSATLIPSTSVSIDPLTYNAVANTKTYDVVYFENSHGHLKSALKNAAGATQDLTALTTGAQTWPYVGTAATTIECTSCHAVHDSANAPFLWAPLAASNATTLDGFCDKCHTERATNNLTANPDGNHPVDFLVDNTAAAGRNTLTRHARSIVIQGYTGGRIFDVANNFTAAAMTGTANSWASGGHLTSGQNAAMNNWTGGASTQQMGCYTCHAAHRNGGIAGENALTVIQTADLNNGWNPLCVGCHGSSTTQAADASEYRVGTTAWGHPVGTSTAVGANGYVSSVGNFNFQIATLTPASWNAGPANNNEYNQLGTTGRVLCTSCHKVHFGTGMSIANLGQGTKAICKQCHSGVGIPNEADQSKGSSVATGANVANSHHVTHAGAIAAGSVDKVGDTATKLQIALPSWRNTTTGLGDVTVTGMDCADCHTFNNTAHNW